jgi:hypothetical protein
LTDAEYGHFQLTVGPILRHLRALRWSRPDYDAGGMNNVIGFNNDTSNTALTIRQVENSPL